jgi:hypothetical protein|tara:strand:- start:447 stop:602 length:156 start_codon:yes stop_codon:yes gene_type:complete
MENLKTQTVKVELTLNELVTLGVMVDKVLLNTQDVHEKEHYTQINNKLNLV